MKTFPLVTLALLTLATGQVRAQSESETDGETRERIRYLLILPEEKTPEVVKPNEPNPFNKGDVNAIKQDDTTSDENKVKDALMALRASGVVFADDGSVRAVMLGQLKLERGMIVPPVLPDQDVHLRVNSLSDTTIELVWIEKKKNLALPPRPVILPIDLRPTVRYYLPSAASAPPPPPSAGKGAVPIGRQSAALLTQPPPPPANFEARRAIPVDETGTTVDSAPTTAPENKAAHPANLLMNLFLNKPQPTNQPAPQAK
jgi:hypothetical protein